MRKLAFKILLILGISNSLYANGIDGLFFSVGAGFGGGTTEFEEGSKSWQSGEKDVEGLAMSLKAGYGVSENLSLFLFRNSVLATGYESDSSDELYGNCVTGLGFNYYFEASNIFYIQWGAGQGEFAKVSDADDGTYEGDGYIFGIGANLADNWHLELTYLGTQIDDSLNGQKLKLETEATQILISYYWY